MHFRCPNCNQPVDIAAGAPNLEATLDVVTCPSCSKAFSLSGDQGDTEVSLTGMKIGHFEVHELVGEGAFGTVYKAWDSELHRNVAIKVARLNRISKETAKQFVREARAAAGIRNPNVVQVFEIGTLDNSTYIVSDFVDGISLSEWLKVNKLSPKDAVGMMLKICRGVQAAHETGVIHRDLKPGNILLNQQKEPLITDFGLAKREAPNEITVTLDGKIFGTPAYMSPEQARGDVRDIGRLSDVYSLGVIFFELLTGRRPFTSTQSRTILYRILTEDPVSPQKINRDVPTDLERICLQALEKVPEKRYASAADFAADLERYLNGFPVKARQYGAFQRASKWVRRNRAISAAILVAAAAVFAIVPSVFRRPAGMVSVIATTDPPATRIVFTRYNDALRVPHRSSFSIESAASEKTWLWPGLYKVEAFGSDNRFHEVWRRVPDLRQQSARDQFFPHKSWKTNEDGTVLLPEFRLFRESDIPDKMASVTGGVFSMGVNDVQKLSPRHEHRVRDLLVGINEVSMDDFRRVLGQYKLSGLDQTYLSLVDARFGDRSDEAGDMPVTGYPKDVAILYCELSGGRLPNHAEWEFVATSAGTTNYSTGESPPVATIEELKVVSTKESSPDESHATGVRNLCFSVGEFTDSVPVTYTMLYPQLFNIPPAEENPEVMALLSTREEVRGADLAWVLGMPSTTTPSGRTRCSIDSVWGTDADSTKNRSRIGWRLFRSKLVGNAVR